MFTEKLDGYARGLAISHLGPGRQLVWHNGGLVPLGYEAFAGVLLGPDREQPPLALLVLANVDMSAVDLTAEVLRVLTGRATAALRALDVHADDEHGAGPAPGTTAGHGGGGRVPLAVAPAARRGARKP